MIWTLFLYKWKRIIKKPALFFVIILFPFILLGSFSYVIYELTQEKTENIKVAVVDEDQTFQTKALTEQLQSEEALKNAITIIPMTSDEAILQIKDNQLSGIIAIPDGFTSDLRSGTNTPITVTTNEGQPLEANMVKLLLESGANYISAAQSGINTVYDLYIRDLPKDEDRSDLIQQLIVQYTLFALDRNKIFEIENVSVGTTVGWFQHGVVAVLLLSSVLSAVLFQSLNYRTEDKSVEERLRSLNCTSITYLVSQFMLYIIFSFVNLGVISLILYYILNFEWLISSSIVITWLLFSILIATLLICLDWFVSNQTSRTGIGIVVMLIGMFLSGVIIPILYLPNWVKENILISPFYKVLEAIHVIILNEGQPFKEWINILSFSCVLFIIVLIRVWIKEGRDGYLSLSS